MDYNKALLEEYLINAVIIVDSKEKVNHHILDYFRANNINFERRYMETGDYGIRVNIDGKDVDSMFQIVIERKNSVDELVGSFKHRQRFANEFLRAKKSKVRIHLLVEDKDGYEKILNDIYRSEYKPKALMNTLKAFETRYHFQTVFLDKKYSGHYIYSTLLFYLREAMLCSKNISKS